MLKNQTPTERVFDKKIEDYIDRTISNPYRMVPSLAAFKILLDSFVIQEGFPSFDDKFNQYVEPSSVVKKVGSL